MWNRSRNGNRKLGRRLNRPCNRYAGKMCAGARRPREPDYLAIACRMLNQSLRVARRMAKADPHIFGPRATEYFGDTLKMEQQQEEVRDALRKVYGPDAPEKVSTLWTDRYFPQPKQRRMFLKWFRENYPEMSRQSGIPISYRFWVTVRGE